MEILWGEDVKKLLPPPPGPTDLAVQAIEFRLSRLRRLADIPANYPRAAFSAYKAMLIAQLVFGERTLDKTKMLDLYLRNVPEFSMKTAGELIIRDYVGAHYPDRPPAYRSVSHYVEYIESVAALVDGG